jgi:hypothetical protein
MADIGDLDILRTEALSLGRTVLKNALELGRPQSTSDCGN